MTVICLMLFITICVLSSALSMKNSLNRSFESYAPRDVELSKRCDIDEDLKDYGYTDEQIEGSKMSIKEILDKLDFDYQKYFKNIEEYAIYTNNEVNLKSVLGDYYENASSKYSSLIYDHKVELMKLSDYNKLVKSLNLKKISLDDNQYAYVANYEMSVNLENDALKTNPKIVIDGKEYLPRYDKCVDGFYEMAGNKINDGFIVLPDSAFVNSKKTFEFLVAKLMVRLFGEFWWDYNNKPFNYKGVICLESTICWGVMTMLLFVLFQPLVERIVNTYYFNFGKPVAIIILLVYALDFSTSFYKAYEAKEQKENNAVTSEDEPELEYIK